MLKNGEELRGAKKALNGTAMADLKHRIFRRSWSLNLLHGSLP
jgi:hypothetical protein